MQQGLSADEARSAIINLGESAAAVDAALGNVAVSSGAASAGMVGLDRSMATASARILVTEAGLGRMGMALSRVGIASGILGPAMAAAFPVLAIVGVVSLLDTVAEKIEKMRDRVLDADIAWQNVDHSTISFNNHLQKSLEDADIKLSHFTKVGMGEFDTSIRTATVDVDGLFQHFGSGLTQLEHDLEDHSKGIVMQFLTGQGGTDEVKTAAKKVQDEILQAMNQGDVPAAQAAIARGLDAIITRENELKSISGSADRIAAYEKLKTTLDGYNRSLALSVDLAHTENQANAAEASDALAKKTHEQGMEYSRTAAREELEGLEREDALKKKTAEDGIQYGKEEAREELEEIERTVEANKKAAEEIERIRHTQLEQIEHTAQVQMRADVEATRSAIAEQEKRGDLSGAKATAAGGFSAEQSMLQGLISAESEYQEAVSHSTMDVEKKNELILASGRRQIELQDQITADLAKTVKLEQEISDKNPWLRMSVELQQSTTMIAAQTGAVATFTSTLNSGVSSALEGWIVSGQKFGQAMEKTFAHVLASEASFVVNWLLKKAELWALDAVIGKSSQTAGAIAAIQANAAVAASGAAAATAMIPYVGPAMAPAAATATYTDTIAWEALAAESGAIVPRTGFIMAHEGEAVLPRNLTTLLQGAAGEGRGGGDTHIHNHINAVDGASVARMLETHGGLFAAAGKDHFRRRR